MNDQAKLVSKVLVLDSDVKCYDRIKSFCEQNNLVGVKLHPDNVMSVMKSNVDLGAILLSEHYGGSQRGGLDLAREIHSVRAELPIFLRRESTPSLKGLPEEDARVLSAAYTLDTIDNLRPSLDEFIFSLSYPNALVRGIAEMTKSALESQFKDIVAEVDTPYIVRDRLIFGEIFTLIPIESSWCRGYMMMQTQEDALVEWVRANKTHITPEEATDFRNLNGVMGEITNLIWGAFKNRYMAYDGKSNGTSQVPIIVNHLHRYISFGSENPQLCFRYTLADKMGHARPLVMYQKFVFNLSWRPEDFAENPVSVEDLVEAGEMEMF